MPSKPTNTNPRSCIREGCDKVFVPRWKNHRCCSKRCASKLGAAVIRARSKKIYKKCALEGCNGIVECWPCTQDVRKFCSRDCSYIAKSMPRIERVLRTCARAECDEVFYVLPKNKKRFCSNRCVNFHNTHPEVLRICLNCDADFKPPHSETVHCSRQCASDARWSDPIWSKEQRDRIGIHSKKQWQDPDYRAHMITVLQRPKSDEHKAALSRARTGLKVSPEGRAKNAEAQRRPEVRARKSAATLRLWQNPNYRKNQIKRLTSMCQINAIRRSTAVGIMESLGLEDLLITTTEKIVQLTAENPSDNASQRYNFRKGHVALSMIKMFDPAMERVIETHVEKIMRKESQNV